MKEIMTITEMMRAMLVMMTGMELVRLMIKYVNTDLITTGMWGRAMDYSISRLSKCLLFFFFFQRFVSEIKV